MTVYVDSLFEAEAQGAQAHAVGARNGHLWCHLFTDSIDLAELHEVAKRIGMRRAWFQPRSSPHYDLTPGRRGTAILAGAVEVDRREAALLLRLRRHLLALQRPVDASDATAGEFP